MSNAETFELPLHAAEKQEGGADLAFYAALHVITHIDDAPSRFSAVLIDAALAY